MKVYDNGPIITMEDEHRLAEVLVEENGKILFVGKASEMPPLNDDVVRIDLRGRTLMPALIDAHSHISDTAMLLKTADLHDAISFNDIVARLQQFIDTHDISKMPFIIGMGYEHNALKEHYHPDRALLDAAFPDIPVIVTHTSMHMGGANKKMLEILKIDETTPDPPCGLIGRIEGSMVPNGYLEETAMNPVYDLICNELQLSVEDILRAEQRYLENGILTIQEGSTDEVVVRLCREAAKQARLTCDLIAYPCFTFGRGIGDSFTAHPECVNHYDNHFKIAGYKIICDGSPQAQTAWMTVPYEGTDNRSYGWLTDEEMQAYTDQAFAERRQLLCHCNGDATADQFLNACERSMQKYPYEDARPVMIHCQTVRDDQLERMAKMNMIASMFVDHVYYWGDVHLANLGPIRGAHISPAKAALERGVVVNFHTDCPTVMPNLFQTVWTAVNRVTKSGRVLGKDQCVTVWEALKAVTIDAAYGYFEEGIKGSLKAGKNADLIIVDHNPLTIDKNRIKDIRVLSCIKDGQVVYDAE